MLIIPADILRAIQSHGESAYPNEGAGLLLGQSADGGKTLVDILPLANEWEAGEQYHRYMITPQDMLRGENEAPRPGCRRHLSLASRPRGRALVDGPGLGLAVVFVRDHVGSRSEGGGFALVVVARRPQRI
jgi:hypothetical protein